MAKAPIINAPVIADSFSCKATITPMPSSEAATINSVPGTVTPAMPTSAPVSSKPANASGASHHCLVFIALQMPTNTMATR
ncbi:hypothetical protein D3C75_1225660 [compost metagenome]